MAYRGGPVDFARMVPASGNVAHLDPRARPITVHRRTSNSGANMVVDRN
jgi:hypothetical protein